MDSVNQPIPRTIKVDGVMSVEKLEELIGWNCEEDELDYKVECDLSRRANQSKIELVRDIVAFANTRGGYIVVGVAEDRTGTPRFDKVGMSEDTLRHFDASTVRNLLSGYIDELVRFSLTTLFSPRYGDSVFGLIFVQPYEYRPIVFVANGQYHDSVTNRSIGVFREGDVFIRRNSSSIRATQSDWRRLLSDIRVHERNRWVDEVAHISTLLHRVEHLLERMESRPEVTAADEPEAEILLLGPERFAQAFNRVLSHNNEIITRQWLNFAVDMYLQTLDNSVGKGPSELAAIRDNVLNPLLDSLFVAAWLTMRLELHRVFGSVIDSFHSIYTLDPSTTIGHSADPLVHFSRSMIWESVMSRIYLIGALAVQFGQYQLIPALSLRRAETEGSWSERFWSRHALTMLAREKRLRSKSLCIHALDLARGMDYVLRLFNNNEDRLISCLCQFDFIQDVVCILQRHNVGDAYPSFGAYYNYRTEPVISDLVQNGPSREAIPSVSDSDLAWAIAQLDRLAGSEFVMYAGWDPDSWQDPKIRAFLQRHR